MNPSQPERVLAALKRHPRGITRVDFQAPNVVDGGAPILNMPGRIFDLRRKGWDIVDAGRRDGCEVYRLRSVVSGAGAQTAIPERGAAVTGVGPAPTLDIAEDKPKPQNAIFDYDEEAA